MGIAMIDTLCATIDIEDYENVAFDVLKLLKQKKKEAQELSKENINEKVFIELEGLNFQILPTGTRGYAYVLHNSDYEIKFSEFRSKTKEFYPIFIKIKSECLWSKSPEIAWLKIITWIENIGEISSNKLARIDLCYHTDNFNVNLTDLELFKGNFHSDNIRRNRRSVNAIEFGSRTSQKIYCRIYNKTLELLKSKKLWFNDIWKNNNLDINNIWNIEFQVDRNFLKEKNIESVEDCFERLQTIWNYCTMEWLVKTSKDCSRIERSSVADDWKLVQNAFINYKNDKFIDKEIQLNYNAEALVPNLAGLATSYGALKGLSNEKDLLEDINKYSKHYLSNKNMNYESAINKKSLTLNERRSEK